MEHIRNPRRASAAKVLNIDYRVNLNLMDICHTSMHWAHTSSLTSSDRCIEFALPQGHDGQQSQWFIFVCVIMKWLYNRMVATMHYKDLERLLFAGRRKWAKQVYIPRGRTLIQVLDLFCQCDNEHSKQNLGHSWSPLVKWVFYISHLSHCDQYLFSTKFDQFWPTLTKFLFWVNQSHLLHAFWGGSTRMSVHFLGI